MEPKYAENLIVAVIFKKKFHWYCTDKVYWQMDYRRRYDEYREQYRRQGKSDAVLVKEIGSFGEFLACRFRIPVLDKDTAKEFLKKIEGEQLAAGELAYKIDHAPEADKKAYVPALYVNFDTKEFYAQDPNREGFERYAPQGWKSAYQDFRKLIPAEAKYWQE